MEKWKAWKVSHTACVMQRTNNKGIVLFISFVFLMLISMGAALALFGVTRYSGFSENQVGRLRAITLAEAGISYAYWKMRTDTTFPASTPVTITPEAGGPNVVITVTGPISGRYKIQSKVTY